MCVESDEINEEGKMGKEIEDRRRKTVEGRQEREDSRESEKIIV